MNINWRDARLNPVYDFLARTRMPLIAHFDEKKAVPDARRDEFLNPLHARVPLDRGVRLIWIARRKPACPALICSRD